MHEAQSVWGRKLQPTCRTPTPIVVEDPPDTFVSVASARPMLQCGQEVVVARGNDPLGDDRPVIYRPATNDWIELHDQRHVGCGVVSPHDSPQGVKVPSDGRGAGFDEPLVRAGRPSVMPRSGCTRGVMPDRKTQESNPHLPVDGVQRVTAPGVARLAMPPP